MSSDLKIKFKNNFIELSGNFLGNNNYYELTNNKIYFCIKKNY